MAGFPTRALRENPDVGRDPRDGDDVAPTTLLPEALRARWRPEGFDGSGAGSMMMDGGRRGSMDVFCELLTVCWADDEDDGRGICVRKEGDADRT